MSSARKRVLVTGAARGLGKAIVDNLTTGGWDVWATDVLPIDAASCRAAHMDTLNVADKADVDRLVASNTSGFDALVNNAAIMPLAAWDQLDLATWQRTLDVNLTGTFLCSQSIARTMRDRNVGGAIVNIASVTYFQGNSLGLHYTASKGGVVALTRSFAAALGKYNIRVNSVAPGIMRTEGVLEQVDRGILPADRVMSDFDPMRTLPGRTEPAGVAEIVAYTLSDAARELTGQLIVASGGSYFY